MYPGAQPPMQQSADQNRRTANDGCGSGGSGGSGGSVISSDKEMMESEFTMENLKQHCRTLLSKTWSTTADITVVPISGGLSNYLFVATLPDTVQTQPDEPNKVLIRVFGEILSQNAESVVLDSVIFALLSEKRMGPYLYGVFKGGRIEEFVANSEPLRRQQLAEPVVHVTVSKHLARLHQLEMPLSKEPNFVFKMMKSWLEGVAERPGDEPVRPAGFNPTPVAQFLRDYRVTEEIEWLKDVFLNKYKFPVVFCHNDLQENNILQFKDTNRRHGFSLQLIDFEYCSYNWRAFDIGNFFNEWSLDYTYPDWPYFSYHAADFPSRASQLAFWRSYLRWYREPRLQQVVPAFPAPRKSKDSEVSLNGEAAAATDVVDDSTEVVAVVVPEDDSDEALLLEAKYGALMSHFFWSVWSLLQASVSSIHFDFKEYAQVRFRLYAKLKSELTGKPSGLPESD